MVTNLRGGLGQRPLERQGLGGAGQVAVEQGGAQGVLLTRVPPGSVNSSGHKAAG